jgi:hypothetical protein
MVNWSRRTFGHPFWLGKKLGLALRRADNRSMRQSTGRILATLLPLLFVLRFDLSCLFFINIVAETI